MGRLMHALAIFSMCLCFSPTLQTDRIFNFKVYKGRKIDDNALLFTADVANAIECSVMCSNHPFCVSFNVQKSGATKRTCQGISDLVEEADLVLDENSSHYRLPFPLTCQGVWQTSCYVVDQGKLYHTQAKAACANLAVEAYLVVLETEAESYFVCDLAAEAYLSPSNVDGTRFYYIGLELNEQTRAYTWQHTQEAPLYYHWLPGGDPEARPGEYAVGIWKDWRGWFDGHGATMDGGYICEARIR